MTGKSDDRQEEMQRNVHHVHGVSSQIFENILSHVTALSAMAVISYILRFNRQYPFRCTKY